MDQANEPVCMMSSFVDISERKQVEESLARYAADLKHSNEELEQFGYVISHDLRAPLRVVRSYLQLLKEGYDAQLDAKAQAYINSAVDSAERMQKMIRALLNLSRVDTRGRTFAPTDCEQLLQGVLANLSLTIAEQEVQVTHDPLPTVRADQAQLAVVFQNLIANAIKFRREGVTPHVHISAEQTDTRWTFSVADNGIGIEADQREAIFQIFQRLHTESEYPGLGIGLALCRRIVARHGGQIWLESAVGTGSTFYFTIPKRLEDT
jgi:light-regulated signal transduction histidine kinase (bacteriophytochrome)